MKTMPSQKAGTWENFSDCFCVSRRIWDLNCVLWDALAVPQTSLGPPGQRNRTEIWPGLSSSTRTALFAGAQTRSNCFKSSKVIWGKCPGHFLTFRTFQVAALGQRLRTSNLNRRVPLFYLGHDNNYRFISFRDFPQLFWLFIRMSNIMPWNY